VRISHGRKLPADEGIRTVIATSLLVVLLAQVVSTALLTGIIWTVQLVHYPLMAHVGPGEHVAYARAHAPRMAGVVMLPWTVQGVSIGWLLITRPEVIPMVALVGAAIAAAMTVLVTIVASVPAHDRLRVAPDDLALRRLVRTNWLRTCAWSIHLALAVWMLTLAVRAG
jgi:hypothetical protein